MVRLLRVVRHGCCYCSQECGWQAVLVQAACHRMFPKSSGQKEGHWAATKKSTWSVKYRHTGVTYRGPSLPPLPATVCRIGGCEHTWLAGDQLMTRRHCFVQQHAHSRSNELIHTLLMLALLGASTHSQARKRAVGRSTGPSVFGSQAWYSPSIWRHIQDHKIGIHACSASACSPPTVAEYSAHRTTHAQAHNTCTTQPSALLNEKAAGVTTA